jgi:hypothetical protein
MSFMHQKIQNFVEGYTVLNLVSHLSIVRTTIPFFYLAPPFLGEQLGIQKMGKMGLVRISPLYHNPVLNKQNVCKKWDMACM